MKKLMLFVILLATACSAAPAAAPTVAPQPTVDVAKIALSLAQTMVAQTAQAVPPSPTPMPLPTNSPVPTSTPLPTQDPAMAAQAKVEAPKEAGFYLVGSEIAIGLWRSAGGSSGSIDCYWEGTSRTGDLLDNDLGPSGITMYVKSNYFAVSMKPDCGTWTYLGK